MGDWANEEQRAYMRSLAKLPLDRLCWCGWGTVGWCANTDECRRQLSRADFHAVKRHDYKRSGVGPRPNACGICWNEETHFLHRDIKPTNMIEHRDPVANEHRSQETSKQCLSSQKKI